MASYVICYDLRAPGRNYEPLYERIRQYPQWGKVTESNWIVVTSWTAVQIRDDMMRFLDTNDRVFVVRSAGEAAWQNVICQNEWLQGHLV